MRTAQVAVMVATAFVVAAGCGSTSTSGQGSNGSGGAIGTTRADITEYQNLSAKVESAASAYRTRMAGTVSAEMCRSVHDQYDAEVRPWVARMGQLANEMDAYITAHGGGGAADMRCTCATMLDELDYHRSRACNFPTLAGDQDEAERDADAMYSYAKHMRGRCGEMLGSGPGGMCCSWGPMMNGCANWSSTCCSSAMHEGCCGQMMMGGGMHAGGCCSGG